MQQKPIELRQITLNGSSGVSINLEKNQDPARNAAFSILAYNGGVVYVEYYGKIVIDLAGLQIPKTQIPILNNHRRDIEAVLGRTETITNSGRKLAETGLLYSLSDETARKIAAKAKDGHPWEASVGVDPLVLEELADGETETVNGQAVTGPLYIARKSRLKETSIVVHGADPETIVDIAAKKQEQPRGQIIIIC